MTTHVKNLASQISRNGTIEGMNQWTLANIDTGSQFMWAHWLSVVLFSGLAFFLCYLLLDSVMNRLSLIQVHDPQVVNRETILNDSNPHCFPQFHFTSLC